MSDHTDDCAAVGDEECRPTSGDWDQPPAYWVTQAESNPWDAGGDALMVSNPATCFRAAGGRPRLNPPRFTTQ